MSTGSQGNQRKRLIQGMNLCVTFALIKKKQVIAQQEVFYLWSFSPLTSS
jgi:hypothetical protein